MGETDISENRLSVEDRLDIADLHARYAWSYDRGDAESYANVFTEDGVIAGPFGEDIKGRAAIITYIRGLFEERGARGWQHLNNHMVVEGGGDSCVAYSYWVVIERSADRKSFGVMTMGHYITQCVRVGGKWLIKERKISDWEAPGSVPWT